jgi:mRNA interferase RelE/StbE
LAYTIHFKPAALRQVEKLPREAQRRLAAKIEALRDDPFPPGCKKMTGDYRVVYQVHRGILLILVLTVGHGREVYR